MSFTRHPPRPGAGRRLRPGAVPALLLLLLLAPSPAAADHGHSDPRRALARDARGAERALERAQDLAEGRGVRKGHELTHALRELAVRLPALRGEERREGEGLLARPTDSPDPYNDSYVVPERSPPHCTASFCVHWVETGLDAPNPADANGTADGDGVPDFVETLAAELQLIKDRETGAFPAGLAWQPPKGDGSLGEPSGSGTANRTDVYLKELGARRLYGYAATDVGQTGASRSGFVVLDNTFTEYGFQDPTAPLRVTAAHEYEHLVQFAYDTLQGSWMLESVATWMEDKVYDDIDSYVRYLPAWASRTEVPLTQADSGKMYGSAVWNHWLDERYGQEVLRRAFEVSRTTTPLSFAPEAYRVAIADRGGEGFFHELSRFSAAVAEWQAPGSGFPEGAAYPDVERIDASLLDGPAITPLVPDGPGVSLVMDHTTFAYFDVRPVDAAALRLTGTLPSGTAGAVALVGRAGDRTTGAVTIRILRLPSGGSGAVELENPAGFSRITAVLVNADVSQSGFSGVTGDWLWTRDDQTVSARVQAIGARAAAPVAEQPSELPAPPPAAQELAPPLDVAAPALAAAVRLRGALARLLDEGLRVRVRCSKACDLRLTLLLDRRSARRLGLVAASRLVVGRRSVRLRRAGQRIVRVRLTRAAQRRLRQARRVSLTLRVSATDPDRNAASVERRLLFRR